MNWVAALRNPDTASPATPEPLERAPFSIDDAIGIEVGRVLEIELPDSRVTFACGGLAKKGPRLIWFKKPKVLGWFMNLESRTPKATEAKFMELAEADYGIVKAAATLFDDFMERMPKGAYTREMPKRSMRHWYSINRVKSTDYWSDRARASREYTHEHTTPVRLYIYGSTRRGGPSFWALHGPKLRFTRRGIEG